MQWTDWATILLTLGLGLVESRRGALTVLVDIAGILIALVVAEMLYPSFISEAASAVLAYVLVFAGVTVLTILVSWHVQLATARLVGPIDMVLAGGAGILVGLAVSYALYHIVWLDQGSAYPPFADSILRPVVHDLTWYHSLVERLTPTGT